MKDLRQSRLTEMLTKKCYRGVFFAIQFHIHVSVGLQTRLMRVTCISYGFVPRFAPFQLMATINLKRKSLSRTDELHMVQCPIQITLN
jgi:hypothetical protein